MFTVSKPLRWLLQVLVLVFVLLAFYKALHAPIEAGFYALLAAGLWWASRQRSAK